MELQLQNQLSPLLLKYESGAIFAIRNGTSTISQAVNGALKYHKTRFNFGVRSSDLAYETLSQAIAQMTPDDLTALYKSALRA